MSLERKLGFLDVFCIASGAMISSGLFILPGLAFQSSGPAMVLAYAIAGLLMIPALLSQSELATAMPRSGGAYFFIERSMGTLPGMFAGLANWFGLALKSAFAMVGIGAFVRLIWGDAAASEQLIRFVAAGCCLVFIVLNTVSVKVAGRSQVIMVFGLLAAIALFVVMGIPSAQQHPNFDNFMGKGFKDVIATAGLVFISFGGLTKVASVAEEVHEPGRNLPRAMFLAFVVVGVLYVAVVFVIVGTLPAAEIATDEFVNLTPVSESAEAFMGRFGLILMSAAAILAFVTTGNGGLMAASRGPMAMSRDGLLPVFFARVSKRFGTPVISVIITGSFMIAVILFLSIEELVKVASTMMLILFVLINVAVLIMRSSRIPNYRPRYRSPLYPWVQLLGIGIYLVLIVDLSTTLGLVPLITTGVFLVLGVIWYLIYIRPNTTRESALVYMVRSVVAREIRRTSLEEKLREISLVRDAIVHDRFDQLVQNCDILDIDGPIEVEEMFRRAVELLSPRLDIPTDRLLEKFRAREADSSTMIQPGLAIPHIIVEGEKLFDILLVRSRNGIIFYPDKPYVNTAFILIGSEDERNYHLRALMAIAQIVQEDKFIDRWLAATDPEQLRDLVLLSRRTRDNQEQ